MGRDEDICASLRAEIFATEAHLVRLKSELVSAEAVANSESTTPAANRDKGQNGAEPRWPLLPEEYGRYGRQMIVSQVGLPGACAILSAKYRKPKVVHCD
jgi:adenylyltransferase/sulfurtransferase